MNTIGADWKASLERLAKRAEDPEFIAEREREEFRTRVEVGANGETPGSGSRAAWENTRENVV